MLNFRKTKGFRLWVFLFLLVAASIIFYKLIDILPEIAGGFGIFVAILRPFVIGFIIAFLLYNPASKIEGLIKKAKTGKNKFINKHSRGFSIAILYLSILIIITTGLSFFIPRLIESSIELAEKIPVYADSFMNYINTHMDLDGNLFGINFAGLEDKASELFNNFKNDLMDFSKLSGYAQGIANFGTAIVDFVLAFVVSIYMLAGRESLFNAGGKVLSIIIPRRTLTFIRNYINRAVEIFYNYIYSQLLDALVVAAMASILFTIIGVPYPLLLAILMGISNLIPYFGAIIGGVIVSLITLISGKWITSIIAVVGVIVLQQIDANLIQPRIVSQKVGIRPIYTLFAITVGGGLFGFAGMLLGVPTFAVIKMIILDIIKHKEKRQSFKNAGDSIID